ncbi:MAG: haloacid dehalogenase-like hydrolase [Candidatus Hydrogenedentes bacterium]|nr:haloacid dehalogenase-like hydrolase [Candidatus Hydrogenedentota bacterium]
MSKSLFLQNIIAVIWDFDKTLSPHYMQTPLFEHYGVEEAMFWREANALPDFYAKAGITVQPDTCYLGHLLTYVQQGVMPGLSNALLRELGASIKFYNGIPEIFSSLKTILDLPKYQEGDLRLEHYVVSTGLAEMIRGSAIAPYLSGVWASEFIETPAPPHFSAADKPKASEITQIAGFLDNTTKTRSIFEINKGVNKRSDIKVNDMLPEEERRVPVRNMVYIADGPSDIPSFSVIREHGGLAYAVYKSGSSRHFAQVDRLLRTGRVDACGPADYCKGGQTTLWLERQVTRIADRMMKERLRTLENNVKRGPEHNV